MNERVVVWMAMRDAYVIDFDVVKTGLLETKAYSFGTVEHDRLAF